MNVACDEFTIIGKVTVAPNVVVDTAGIQTLVKNISCTTPGFPPDGQIGHPVSDPLSSYITGGLLDIAQIDRVKIIGETLNANIGLGDTYIVTINGSENYSVTTNDISPVDLNPDQSASDIAISLASQITGGSSSVFANANVGGLGTLDIQAIVPGIVFTSTVTHVTDDVTRITLQGSSVLTDTVTITVGGTTYFYPNIAPENINQIANSLVTLMATNTLVRATSGPAGSVDLRSITVGGVVGFSNIISSTVLSIISEDRTTQFTTETLRESFLSNYIYSWSAAGDPGFSSSNLEIINLPPDDYTLTVSIDGITSCETIAGPFTIEEPSITIGTVVETCGGIIEIPITGIFTTDQMSGIGNIMTANLYQGTAGSSPNFSLFETINYPVGSLPKIFTETPRYTGLTPGLVYRLEVITNTCSTPETIDFGPISAALEIDETLITVTDQICAGETDGTISVPLNAITGGSGSYNFLWKRLSPNPNVTYNVQNLDGISPGFWELTVTDTNISNCEVSTIALIEVKGTVTNVNILPSGLNVLANSCISGTDGQIEIKVSGTDTAWIEWEYLVTTNFGVVSSSLSSSTLTPNRRNLLPANFIAEELNPTGGISSFEGLPAGIYRVKVYSSNPNINSCADVSQEFVITEPSPIIFSIDPEVVQPDWICGTTDSSLGTIRFSVTGGQSPYFYSLTGGEPTEVFDGAFLRDDLPPGSYDIAVSDSSGCATGANNLIVQQTIVLTDPLGNPLVLTEGTITPIPCGGGIGQFIIETQGGIFAGTVTQTNFPVRIVAADGSYILNTTINPGENIVVDNISNIGTYNVAVTDESGCNPSLSIDVVMTTSSSADLSADASLSGVQNCSAGSVSANGPTITINGGISGGVKPHNIKWERRSQLNLDTFSISFIGVVSATDIGNLGVVIDGTTFTSSLTINNSTSILDIASDLAITINSDPVLEAYLSGSSIIVRAQFISSAQALSINSVYGLRMNLSSITISAQTVWNEVPNTAGLEVLSGLSIGYYRGIVSDASGCSSILIRNDTQGGYEFEINDPSKLEINTIEFDKITCSKSTASIRFKLGNGQFDLIPDPTVFEFSLNGTELQSTLSNGSSLSSTPSSSVVTNVVTGNTYSPNLLTNIVLIQDLKPGIYNLDIKNTQTGCPASYTFTIEDLLQINYSGITDFSIDACYDSFQDPFFDQFLITGGSPYSNSSGQPYYALSWTYYPDPTSVANSTVFNGSSNNVNFLPLPGVYLLGIEDKNGCTLIDQSGNSRTIQFKFVSEFNDIQISGVANTEGDFSNSVSCQIDAKDGSIAVSINNQDGSSAPPYQISWEIQGDQQNENEAILLFQGVSASQDSLEVYSVLINNLSFTYITQSPSESITSIVQEMAQVIDSSPQYSSAVESAPNGGINVQDVQIRISSISGASISLEIVSQSTQLTMLNSTVSSANWNPLDGSNGTTNWTGYTSLNNLAEGNYRYTITPEGVSNCVGSNLSQGNKIQGVIEVLNENVLQIRQGPTVDPALCRGQAGTIFIDVFSGQTGPLTFKYNGNPVTSSKQGTDQYLINISSPVPSASLEIFNVAGCGLARQINIGIGEPLFDFNSVNFQQTQQFIAREDVTFRDLSQDEYDSFEFFFGDGTRTERLERNQPNPITHEFAISGTYYVTLRIYNDLDCVEELTQTIKIGKGYNVLSPNVFTPNGDIYNQCFKPLFNGLSEATFRVYDAQGALLYEEIGTPPVNILTDTLSLTGWCGPDQSEGKKDVITPYLIYTLEGKTVDGVEVFRDGTFLLLR